MRKINVTNTSSDIDLSDWRIGSHQPTNNYSLSPWVQINSCWIWKIIIWFSYIRYWNEFEIRLLLSFTYKVDCLDVYSPYERIMFIFLCNRISSSCYIRLAISYIILFIYFHFTFSLLGLVFQYIFIFFFF